MSGLLDDYFKEWEITEDAYRRMDPPMSIGWGGSGSCEKVVMEADDPNGRWKEGDFAVAKTLKRGSTEKNVAREILISASLKLDGILPLYGYVRKGDEFILVSKLIGGHSLDSVVTTRHEKKKVFGWNNQVFAKVMYKLAKILGILHRHGFIYRDFKPENIVFGGLWDPYLIDFGTSRGCGWIQGNDITQSKLAETFDIGTSVYMAPELLSCVHNEKVDVYAFGMTLYIYFMKIPTAYDDNTPVFGKYGFNHLEHPEKISNGVRFKKCDTIPECYWELITRCWDQDPCCRPSFDEICTLMESRADEFCLATQHLKRTPNTEAVERYKSYIKDVNEKVKGEMDPKMKHVATEINYCNLVVESAEFIYDHSVNVRLGEDKDYIEAAALVGPLVAQWKPESWASNPLHPAHLGDPAQKAAWIFLIDTLNFAFWTPPGKAPFTVTYAGKAYTGYWSLCAAIRRALDDGEPILDCKFWSESTAEDWARIFRSDTETQVPLLDRRVEVVNEAGKLLTEKFNGSAYEMIRSCRNSAIALVTLVRTKLTSYRDQCNYKDQTVFFLKRAQILAADLHYGFLADGDEVCHFNDISKITMFADYRVPQVLRYLKLITYTPELVQELTERPHLKSGSEMECEIRACSILAVEKLKTFIGDGAVSVLIDFALWDYAKANSSLMDHIPIHKTESVFY